MKKTFKKSIAVLLAVLMMVLSVPFSAFAAAGDYKLNLDIQFGVAANVINSGVLVGPEATADVTVNKNSTAITSMDQLGLYGPPVDYDKATGTLTLKAAKAAEYCEGYGVTAPTKDYTYQVGDYFTATFVLEGASVCRNLIAAIKYSENIEPAGIYRYGTNMNFKYQFRGISDVGTPSAGTPANIEAGAPISNHSAVQFYGTINEITGDLSFVDTDRKVIRMDENSSIPSTDVSACNSDLDNGPIFFSPEDGSMGYNYENRMICTTFMFKITGDGPITFAMDPYKQGTHDDPRMNYYIAAAADGTANKDYTTYGLNNCTKNYIDGIREDGLENPGSKMLYFMGKNIDGLSYDSSEETHTHSFEGAVPVSNNNGTHTITCTGAGCDESDGYQVTTACTAAADKVGFVEAGDCQHPGFTGNTVCKDCGYVMEEGTVVPAGEHSYTAEVTKQPTCTEAGVTTWTCSVCGDNYTTDEPAALNHDYTGAQEIAGDDVNHKVVCKNDPTHENGTAPHSYGEEQVIKEASVTEEGSAKKVCEACGHEWVYTLEKLTCEHSFVNYVYNNDATCTADGTETATCENGCGETDTRRATGTMKAHTYTNYVSNNDATCTADGTKTAVCDECGVAEDTVADEGSMKAHTYTNYVSNNDATCTADGTKTAVCDECGIAKDTVADEGSMKAHTYTNYVSNNDATCTADGTKTAVCDECGVAEDTVADEGSMKAHTYTNYVSNNDATCTADGTKTAVCDECGVAEDTVADEGSMKAHTYTNYVYNNDATIDKDGTETAVCDECGVATDTRDVEGSMLDSFIVTVDAADMGKVTLNGEDVTKGAQVKIAAGSKITLVAEPANGATFLGWKVNNATTVDTAETHEATVLANITYTPVFDVVADNEFTVQFMDAFGNIIDVQSVASGADIVIPVAPARPGYVAGTDNGWSLSDAEIADLKVATTITAQYAPEAEKMYTITAAGATLSAPGFETATDSITVPYDTKVTVTKEGAKGWTVKDAKTQKDIVVSYSDTYTFFVTADLELTAQTAVEGATPTVANVGVSSTGVSPRVQGVFKATRTMVDGYTYINSGFIYGKGDLGDVKLADVNGSSVKATYNKTNAEQFTLTYGLAAQTGTISARAFLVYADAEGKTVEVYAATQTFEY